MVRKFNKTNVTRVLTVFAFLFFIGVAFFILFQSNRGISGNVVLDIDSNYVENQSLNGLLEITLSDGELIPADSVLEISSGGIVKDYILSDVVSSSQTNGDFYLKSNENIKGNGVGYGNIKKSDEVDFTLLITSDSEKSSNSGGNGGGSSSDNVEVVDTPTDESIETTETSENEATIDSNTETEITPTETTNTEPSTTEETTSEIPTTTETTSEGSTETSNTEVSGSESAPTSEESGSGITGAVVKSGKEGKEVKGKVSKDTEFTYELSDGESVEVLDSSQPVSLVVEGNTVSVTTDYSSDSSGGEYKLSINLEDLNYIPEDGELKITLSYNGEEILSETKNIVVSSETPEETTNEEITNETSDEELVNGTIIESNITTNVTTNITKIVNVSSVKLSDEDLFLIKGKTGSSEIKVSKSEVVNDRLLIRFEIGSYWSEKTYDYNLDSSIIDKQIENDKLQFAKNLANKLKESKSNPEVVEGYLGSYNLSS